LKGDYFSPAFIDEAPPALAFGAREAFRKGKYRFEARGNYGFPSVVYETPNAANRRRKQRPRLVRLWSRMATPGSNYCQKSTKCYPSSNFSNARIA
jgi:hypothetical protein